MNLTLKSVIKKSYIYIYMIADWYGAFLYSPTKKIISMKYNEYAANISCRLSNNIFAVWFGCVDIDTFSYICVYYFSFQDNATGIWTLTSQRLLIKHLLLKHNKTKQWYHNDIIEWKHFLCNWTFVWEIYRSSMNFPHKSQWRGALVFSLICAWTNCCLNNRYDGDLSRDCAHYDATIMYLLHYIEIYYIVGE